MPTWIRTREALELLAADLQRSRGVALDSESDSLHHHFQKVCLIQIGGGTGDVALVDPLAFSDLSPLRPVFADPALLKVLHGADYDVTTLKRDFGFEFAGLFDTMIAARFLGRPAIGLQALAAAELGVALSKESQKDDWSRRPLTPRQEAYAADDVRHLLALHERLAAELRAAGRLDWVLEECAAVAALEPARRGPEPDAHLRIKGAARLKPRGLAVLRELHRWREAQAEASDVPAFRILGTEPLLEMAAQPPRSAPDVRAVGGLSPRARQAAGELLAAIERALNLPESELPSLPPARRPVVPEPVRRRIDALRDWRQSEAQRLALDVSVVLPQRLLEKVAEAAPRSTSDLEAIPGLRRWRVAAFGAALSNAAGSAA